MKPVRLLALAAAVGLLAGAAKAEPTIAQYEQFTGPQGAADMKVVFPMWLAGVGLGMQWMNNEDVKRGQPGVFCAPDTFGSTADQFDALLRDFLKKRRAALDPQRQKDLAEFPTGLVMLNAMKDAFPCKK
jgi:hypothetical protein